MASEYLGDSSGALPWRTGLAALEELDDIAIVCMPDAAHPALTSAERSALTLAVTEHCEKWQRFGVLSCEPQQLNPESVNSPLDSSAVAIYYPWIRVADAMSDRSIGIPPVGHVAGTIARSDRERGIAASPAGIDVRGLAGSDEGRQLTYDLDDAQADMLVRRGVNVLSRVPGKLGEVVVESAITTAIDDDSRPIQVRRFLNFFERSIHAGTSWLKFEANDEATWAEVRSQIEEFLARLWRSGALAGDRPEEAYFVRCDRGTMTDHDIQNGRVVVVVGVVLADTALRFPSTLVLSARPSPKTIT